MCGLVPNNTTTFADWHDPGFLAYVEELRTFNSPIGVVNGVFDLFHLGHMNFLRQVAAYMGESGSWFMIALVNSDASVSRLKGAHRPYAPLAVRMHMLDNVGVVDICAGFDTDTPEEALSVIRPDFLFKGQEYTGQAIAGSESCKQTILVPMTPGWHTSAIEERIAAAILSGGVPAARPPGS